MTKRSRIVAALCLAIAAPALLVYAQDKKDAKAPDKKAAAEHERKVKESEVPAAAVAALKKLAAGAEITQYEQAVKHGETTYEGQWKTRAGKMEVVVTPAGDMVASEEGLAADAIPSAVVATAKKAAGGSELQYEKVTEVHYKAKYKKDDQRHKMTLSPTGRTIKSEAKTVKPEAKP